MFLPLLFTTATTIAHPLTIEEIAEMPAITTPQISPDGKRIVYVLTTADMERSVYQSDLWEVDAGGSHDVRLTSNPANDNHPRWSPDGSKIAFLSDRDGGRDEVWILDARGGEPQKLTDQKAPISDFEWSPDGKTIAFIMRDPTTAEEEKRIKEREDWHLAGEVRHTHLYLIDVNSRTVTRLTHGDFSVMNPSWSPDGLQLAVTIEPGGISDYEKTDIAVVSRSGAIRKVVVRPGADLGPQFSPDGKWIAFTSAGGVADWLREGLLYVVPAAGGEPHLIGAAYGRSLDHFVWNADSQTIWFDGPWDTTGEILRVGRDGSGFRDVSHVDGVINNLDVHDGEAAFVMQSMTEPPELYVAEIGQTGLSALHRLTHHNDAYRDRQLAETRIIHWKNPKDGLPIEGLLTLPVGYRAGTRVPLLTFVHGGPASHFDQGFIGYLGSLYPVQVFAQHGFAVLRPNPRGTGGYGQKFREANRNDWGGMDWMDINAGIDKLIADGIADPHRLGMMGWSYGGFLTAWAEGHSDRLKAISIGAPVVDLLSFHGTTDIRAFIPSYFPGVPAAGNTPDNTDDATLAAMRRAPLSLDLLRAHSPIWHLKRSRARILIQQGDIDERVPLSQGTMLYRMLQELGVDVTMVMYPRSHHVPGEPKERIEVMRENVNLFDATVALDR